MIILTKKLKYQISCRLSVVSVLRDLLLICVSGGLFLGKVVESNVENTSRFQL